MLHTTNMLIFFFKTIEELDSFLVKVFGHDVLFLSRLVPMPIDGPVPGKRKRLPCCG